MCVIRRDVTFILYTIAIIWTNCIPLHGHRAILLKSPLIDLSSIIHLSAIASLFRACAIQSLLTLLRFSVHDIDALVLFRGSLSLSLSLSRARSLSLSNLSLRRRIFPHRSISYSFTSSLIDILNIISLAWGIWIYTAAPYRRGSCCLV